ADRDRGTPLNGNRTIAGSARREAPRAYAADRAALGVMLALMLGGCSSSLLTAGVPPAGLPGAPRILQQPPGSAPTQREHQRILAAYNGHYAAPELDGMANPLVAKPE